MARRVKKSGSKSAAIREYQSANPDAKPKEIAENLNKSGFKITPQYVSTILSSARKKRNGNGRRRRPVEIGSSLDHLLAAKKLVREVGSLEAAQQAISQFGRLMA